MNHRLLAAVALIRSRAKVSVKKGVVFPEQDRFVQDPSEFIAALCTRRAGKTNGLALRFKKQMDKFPGKLCRYLSLTRDSAKDIMWPVLHELNETYNWQAEFTEHNLTMTIPNGAMLKLTGADMKNFRRRLRGVACPAIAIDEAQEFASDDLADLIDNILGPSLADFAPYGWLALTGTPGPVPMGLFYDITNESKGGYSVHKWSLYQNPHMPDPRAYVERLKIKNEWDDQNPTLLREWKGIWVLDANSLLIKYSEQKNHFHELPAKPWVYILGVDIGFRDADALAVIAWSEATSEIYLVDEVITDGQDITTLSTQMEAMIKKYDIAKIVMDEGGLGKKVAEEIRRRKHIPVQPADKSRKMENVAFLNEWLRLGRFKARKDSRFARDSFLLQIDYEKSTPDKLKVKDTFHSDIVDAVLYAFKESPAFTFQASKQNPKYGSKEWCENEEDEMFEKALEHFTSEEDKAKAYGEF